ncbi:hypothetical protein L0244_08805 [bacterium]|nr:hypothetical protein [bacterium]
MDQADTYCSRCGNPIKVAREDISKNLGPTQAAASKTFSVKGKEIHLGTKKKFMNIEEAKKTIFAKIETRGDALKTIKETAITFLVISGIQAAIGYFIAPSMIIDAVLFTVFSLILLKWKARTAAVIQLLDLRSVGVWREWRLPALLCGGDLPVSFFRNLATQVRLPIFPLFETTRIGCIL